MGRIAALESLIGRQLCANLDALTGMARSGPFPQARAGHAWTLTLLLMQLKASNKTGDEQTFEAVASGTNPKRENGGWYLRSLNPVFPVKIGARNRPMT
jgi:hypothetical protein